MLRYRFPSLSIFLSAVLLAPCVSALALDRMTIRRDGQEVSLEGRTVIRAKNGGVMLQTRDGRIWLVQPEEVLQFTIDDVLFEPYTSQELAQRMLGELPPGFEAYHTANYVICYSTSRGYAQWCGSLFERLHMAFTNCWRRRGFHLVKHEFPLSAVVFADRASYLEFARPEVGEAVGSVIAYYSLTSNRIVMYDLTGAEARGGPGRRVGLTDQINRILSQPAAAPTVATIVHEATHQLAFNCGLHTRQSDCPLWFSEGIAIYFETPDLSSRRGWGKIGLINRARLNDFRDYVSQRPSDSLVTLIVNDDRFRDPARATAAYAEAWTLTHFLLTRYPRQYIAYMKVLSEKQPQIWDSEEQRLEEFKQAFGEDLQKLDGLFVRYGMGLR